MKQYTRDDVFSAIITVSFVVLTCVALMSFLSHVRNDRNKLDVIYESIDAIASTTDAQAREIRELKRQNADLIEQIERQSDETHNLNERLDDLKDKVNKEIDRIDENIDILTQAKTEEQHEIIETAYFEPAIEIEPEENGIVSAAVAFKSDNTYMEELDDNGITHKVDPNPVPTGAHLTPESGTFTFDGHTETYYNLDMSVVVQVAQSRGISGEYHVRSDGAKMIGDYIMVAADYNVHPYGSIVQTSLGAGIVVDTGGFVAWNPYNVDIATTW